MTAKYGIKYNDLLEMHDEVFELYRTWMRIDDMRQQRQAIVASSISGKEAQRATRELQVLIDKEMYRHGIEPDTGVSHSPGPRRQHAKASRQEVMKETKQLRKKKEKKNGS